MKANCKRQKADLEALLARLKDCPLPADEMQRMLQIEQVYEQELSRLKQLKQLLSKKAQEIQLLRRKIDDVPTRTELVQYVLESLGSLRLNFSTCVRYERRFVELYEQVAGTTDETKKYYTTYNTLQNTKDFILKESKVMDRQDPVSAFFIDFSRLHQRLRQFPQKFRQKAVRREYGGHFERRWRLCSKFLLCRIFTLHRATF